MPVLANEPLIGIDLGTTYCCVYYWKDGKTEIIENSEGDRTTPSYVAFTDTDCLVGAPAKIQAEENPKNTIFNVKRLIGLTYHDTNVQRAMNMLPYKIINKEGRPCIEVLYQGSLQHFYPEEISAILLRKLKKDAELILGTEIKKAVITVPEHFNSNQRKATKLAGTIAGLVVEYIFNEPTAAALAYGYDVFATEIKKILVFDLGGGTFDVTLLSMGDRVIEVKKTRGNRNLGGEDFVERMVQYCLQLISKKTKKNEEVLRNDKESMQSLRNACELTKKKLSTAKSSAMNLYRVFGMKSAFKPTITRDQFIGMNKDYFDETINTVASVVLDAGIDKSKIDEIIMIGGSSRIPFIRESLKSFFGRETLNHSLNPDEAVAKGAALNAAGPGIDWAFDDVTSHSIGIESKGDEKTNHRARMNILVQRNTVLPCKGAMTVVTSVDNQKNAKIKIFEGEDPFTDQNELMSSFKVSGLTPMPAYEGKVNVVFDITKEGILKATAKEVLDDGSGVEAGQYVQITQIGSLTDAQIEDMMNRVKKFDHQ